MDEKERHYHERYIAQTYAQAIRDLAGAIRFLASVIEAAQPIGRGQGVEE